MVSFIINCQDPVHSHPRTIVPSCHLSLNQLLLKEGYAKGRDYLNEFNPADWACLLEYLAILSSRAFDIGLCGITVIPTLEQDYKDKIEEVLRQLGIEPIEE